MIPRPEEQQRLRKKLPELDQLPDDWEIVVTASDRHLITYSKDGRETTDHPHWGPLPKGWSLRLFKNAKTKIMEPRYENKRDMKTYVANPRVRSEVLKAHSDKVRKVHEEKDSRFSSIAGNMRKSLKGDKLSEMKRAPIADHDISHHYEYLHCLDGRADQNGGIGGMNGGVFVVRLRGTSELYVEKRFKKGDQVIGAAEIKLIRRLKHASLNFFINAYITPERCAVWLEFCDQGSLKDITSAYESKRNEATVNKPHMPEKWLWHCYIGLCDGLAYLATGLYFISAGITDPKAKDPKWIPIVHRDIKPDNIFLRSRATTRGRKYFYCVISDFGLAVEEFPEGDPRGDHSPMYWGHVNGAACGTPYWIAPELCHPDWELAAGKYFPDEKRHTAKSDLWAVATIIYTMAECDDEAHLKRGRKKEAPLRIAIKKPKPDGPFSERYGYHGFCIKMYNLSRLTKGYYSKELRVCIVRGARVKPEQRPTPQKLVIDMAKLVDEVYEDSDSEPTPEEMLPDWASKKHDFHSREPKTAEELMS